MALFPNPDTMITQTLKKLAPFIIQKLNFYLGAEFGFRSTESSFTSGGAAFNDSGNTWSTSNELRIKSGKLYRSFSLNNSDTLTDFTIAKNGLKITYGSKLPYASIHEFGGFVRSKGNMHKYFWAKYFETDNEFYKIMALSVLKKGGVNIPKRAYFNPALKEFNKKGLTEILNLIINDIIKKMNG